VVPPHLVTEPKVNRVKTDKRDAKRLAFILEHNDVPSVCDVPDRERREDRQVSRTLIALQKDITRTRNRIRTFVEFHGIELPFSEARWGRTAFRTLKKLPLREPLRISLDVLLSLLEQLWAHQATLRTHLRELSRKVRYRNAFEIARSAPGIGWFTAIRLVLELGEDWSRFASGKRVAGFVGLVPGEYSTGETTWKGHITGMGSGFVRSTLIENSWAAIRKDPALLGKFMRVWRGTGSKKKAIVAAARMLLVRLRACLGSGTPYAIGVVR
jgi:transposase